MMKLIKLSSWVVLSMLMLACSSEDDEELIDVVFAESSKMETVDASYKYAFTVLGDSNFIALQGDLGEVTITGSSNFIVIEEDTFIEKLVITGSRNSLEQADDLSVTIETIKITSDSNIITISEYIELDDAGEDNQVALTYSGESSEG